MRAHSPLYYHFRNMDYVEARDERRERAQMAAEDWPQEGAAGAGAEAGEVEEGALGCEWWRRPLGVMQAISRGTYPGAAGEDAEGGIEFAGLGVDGSGRKQPVSARDNPPRTGLGFVKRGRRGGRSGRGQGRRRIAFVSGHVQ